MTDIWADARIAVRNSGLRPSLRSLLWFLLANAENINGRLVTIHRLPLDAMTEMTGLGSSTLKPNLRTLIHAEWITYEEDGRIALTPPDAAVAGPVIYRRSELSAYAKRCIKDRDGWRCTVCDSDEDLTVDHVIPQRYGGSNQWSNLRTLCRSCNCSKGARI